MPWCKSLIPVALYCSAVQCRLVQYSLSWVWSHVSAFQIITNFKNSHFSKQVLTTVVICQKCRYVERNSLKIPPLHMSFKPTICFWTEVCKYLPRSKGSNHKYNVLIKPMERGQWTPGWLNSSWNLVANYKTPQSWILKILDRFLAMCILIRVNNWSTIRLIYEQYFQPN